MPPNGEKQSRWLMGCKCGARVKASAGAAGMIRCAGHFSPDSGEPGTQAATGTWPGGHPAPIVTNLLVTNSQRVDCRQELWAIEARASGETVASVTNDARSALRWNSIRRSKALERI